MHCHLNDPHHERSSEKGRSVHQIASAFQFDSKELSIHETKSEI